MKSWDEIRKAATVFSNRWKNTYDEKTQSQCFPKDFFAATYTPSGDLLVTHTYTNGTDAVTETYAYDMLGNRIATTAAHGNTIYRTYDPFGRILSEWGATYPVCYTYDTAGRRTSLSTTRDGVTWDTTTWTYDHATGNCLSKAYADGSTVLYTYTPDNLLLRTTYASGKWKENVYDSQRRLCGVVYSSPDMDYELQLDDYGNATNVAEAAGNSWRYEYGFHSKLLAEKYATSGGPRSVAATNNIVRAYDSFDRPTGYALSINGTSRCGIGYAYDDDGDLTHITATNSAGRSFSVAYTNVTGYSYGYTITTPNGDVIRRSVDRDEYRRNLVTNCATYFNSSLGDSNLYAFDALSRPTARTTGTTGVSPVDSTFAYNNRSEVVSAAIGTNFYAHAYDDIGNHLLFGDNAVTNTFTHNPLNQMVGRAAPSAPPTAFTYTPDGGISSDGMWSYAYDAEDQLTIVTSSSLTNGAIRVLNSYDYRRRRTSKTVQRLYSTISPPPAPPTGTQEWETIETRTFVYDDWNLIHETIYTIDGGTTNTTDVQYFWGLDLSGTIQGAGGVGGLLAVSRNGQFYFPTFDNNGNITKYIDESGSVVAAYEYDDFGRTISLSGPLADFFCHRFSTKYYDSETCLYDYGIRNYSPNLCIWLNRDLIEEEGGVNLYLFCDNNCMQKFDKLGATTAGHVLESFFAKTDAKQKLWVMGERDAYTAIVRKWNPVKCQTDIIKSLVAHAPRDWSTSHTTTPSWKPRMRSGFDPRSGYVGQVKEPPGTDPGTAAKAYAIYIFTTIQTESLHTSSIGSFSIAATVDVVSFQPCKAIINVWMYNEMSSSSFGQFADSWVYRGRALPTQFMWWNWKERISFDARGGYRNEN